MTGAQQGNFKKIIFWSLVVTFSLGIVFFVARVANPQSTKVLGAVSSSDWTRGNRVAKTVLVEYSDFQCSACATYYSLLKMLEQELNDKVLFVYRHFPLSQYQKSHLAAQAAEAAGKQGKFWEMSDLIFEKQNEWVQQNQAESFFFEYAKSLDLDLEKFKNDFSSAEIKAKIEADLQSGISAGVNSTPTFFLNGEKIQFRNFQEFKDLILAVK